MNYNNSQNRGSFNGSHMRGFNLPSDADDRLQVIISDSDNNNDQYPRQHLGDFEQHQFPTNNHYQHEDSGFLQYNADGGYDNNQSLYENQQQLINMNSNNKQPLAIQYVPEKKERNSFMGSVKDEESQEAIAVPTTKVKKIVDMFEEDDANVAKKAKQQAHQIQITTEDEDNRLAGKVGKKKKKKKKALVQNLMQDDSITTEEVPVKKNRGGTNTQYHREYTQYNDPPMEKQQYVRQNNYSRPQTAQSNFDKFQQNFYPNMREPQQMMTGRSGYQNTNRMMTGRSNMMFEPQFITQNPNVPITSRSRMLMPALPINAEQYPEELEKWVAKPTQQGFLYFHLKGTKTYQWNFPRFYDTEVRKTRPYFVDHWIKKYDNRGKKYWQNMHSKHIQHIKPDSETYLIQASIAGNQAFIELYVKSQGELVITDQQRRTALHHSCSNGHREITALLCEFSYSLLEMQDVNGCTALFMAVRYNEVECLKLLISYDSNLFHKMRNGDTCLHVAAAYNSLESMIILTNFGGMELFEQKNRYGLRAIDIAKKMRNYECFEVLQKLERNVHYQNAIMEREIQSWDQMKGTKSYRQGRQEYFGSNANYPAMSSRREPIPQASHRAAKRSVPNLHLSQIKNGGGMSVRSNQVLPTQFYEANMDDSSIIYNEEPSALDLPLEDPDEADDVFQSLGGRNGYQQRMANFHQQSKTMRHERKYIQKMNSDRNANDIDQRKRAKYDKNIEFNDYQKSLREGVTPQSPDRGTHTIRSTRPKDKHKLKQIQEELSSDDSGAVNRKNVGNNQRVYRNVEPQIVSETDDYDMRNHRPQPGDISQRNQSIFKLSIRDDSKMLDQHHSSRFFENQQNLSSARRRGKSAVSARTQLGDSEGPSRFLQRHVASRFLRQDDDGAGDMITSTTDEEALRRLNSKSNTHKRPISSPSLGDPWKVSRSRDRSTRSAVTARDDMSDTQQPSYAEIAYDKTTAIVQSVKGLLATGISKIKTLIGKQPPTVSISRTSKSRKRGRQLSSSEDSYERYKTPNNGRSQSRKAQQQEPMEMSEGEVGERKSRHVNFNINRVVSPQPEEVRAKSAVSQRQAQSNKKTIQIQADSQPIKSVLKNSAREPSQMSAKSVGVGSHNINSSVNHQATSSNQEQLLSAPPLPMMQSIQSSVPSDKQQHRAVDQPKSTATNNLKPKQIFLRKNYQSSEERVGPTSKSQRVNTNEDQWQQLSDSSRQSSQQRQRIVQEINQRQQQLIKQLAADSSVQSNVKTNSNGQHSLAKSNAYLATAISTNQKSNNNGIIGSLNGGSQKGKPHLSQEQFELIMSEQEETVKKNLMGKQLQMKQQASPVIKPPELPKPLSIAEQNNVDIQRFYEDLLDNTNSVSIQVATNLPVKIAGQAPPTAAPIIEKDTLDESNLSNLYNRIMSDHQEIIAPRQQTAQVPPEEKVEVSLVESEFNPPTQNIGTSVLFKQQDLTFQSGMTDLRKALQEEEEVLDNISNCSFIDEDGAKKINQQIIQSNILDKGQFLGSQNNSLHHSISSAANRQQSVGARPTGMQILRNQNNSMHFNTFGNSFACQGRYQSDNEDNNLPIQNPTSNILRKQQHETPQKIGLPAAPKSANHNNITNNQSMQFTQQEIQPQAVAPQPGSGNAGQGSAQSDNTSSSAAVVIHSQNSHATQKLSQPDPHQQMINLFKEDQELQFQSSPQTIKLPLPTNRQPADDTQTDLETGFNPKKQAKNTEDEWATQHNDDQQLNTFQGLSSISEHKFQEQQQLRCGADNSTEQEIKKSTIMRKLIEIMDESHINDDQTPSQSSVTNKPSEQSQSIQQQPVLLADEEEEADLLSDRPKKQKIEMIDKKGGDSHQPRSTVTHRANSSTRRGNTRYGGGEHDAIDDSMIQFDLTSSKIIENENEDKRRQQYMEESKQQRKSLKLQIQEQIQSIVVSEENQQMPKNTQGAKELKTELEAVVMPLIILKAAVDGPLEVRETHLMDVSAEEEGEATSIPKKVDRKYLAANKEDDSISRIYNELETVQEESISQVKVMPVVPQITTSVVKAFEPIPEDEVKLPSLATLSGRKDSLPPLIRYQSEDDERKPVHELFYPKEQQSTRRSVSGNLPTQEDNQAVILPGSTLQWNRDDKQNRSTATPLFNYATSSEDEGNTNRKSQSRDRQQKMAKLLSKYQLESVANKEIPLPQPLHQSPIAHQPSLSQQRTIRDVSFKSHNISTHTDTSERLKENLKLFSKNRLLQKANNQQAKKDEIPKSNISAAKQQ